MKNKNEILERIDKPYISSTCVQISESYRNSLTIFNRNGIIYHDVVNFPCTPINKYIKDNRRNKFPFCSIPIYISQSGLSEIKHTIQLLNYNEIYVLVKDGEVYEKYVVRDGDRALLLTSTIKPNKRTVYQTRMGLESLLARDKNNLGSVYLMNLDGVFYTDYNSLNIPSEEEMVKWAKDRVRRELLEYRKRLNTSEDDGISNYTLELISNSIDNMTIDSIPNETYLTEDDIVVVRTDNQNITISVFTIMFMKEDCYKIDIYDYHLNRYNIKSLEDFKYPVIKYKGPKISPILNFDIPKGEIEKQNKLARRLKR